MYRRLESITGAAPAYPREHRAALQDRMARSQLLPLFDNRNRRAAALSCIARLDHLANQIGLMPHHDSHTIPGDAQPSPTE